MNSDKQDPPFEHGAQPVPERAPEVPTAGRSVMQTVVVVIGALVVLAGLVYLLSPLFR